MRSKVNFSVLAVLLAGVFWGTAGIYVRTLEKYEIGQMQLVLFRALFSAIIFAFIVLFKDKKLFKVRIKDLWVFACGGLFSIVLFNFSYYKTMSLTTLSVAAVLLYTAPIFVCIMARLFFKEKLNMQKVAACVIAFLGCCFVTGLFEGEHNVGAAAVGFGLLTGLGYALYTIFTTLAFKRGYKTLTITFYIFLFAAIFSLPLVDLGETVSQIVAAPVSLVVLAAMALLNTVAPYILYTTGLKGVDASAAPIIATIEPVVATVISVAYGEEMTLLGGLGIVLVLGSVVLLNFKYKNIKAYAKINLCLKIDGKREDGYHLIDTVMQSVSLKDKITVTQNKNIKVICSNKAFDGEDNIATAAAKLFFSETGISGGAKIKITKKIPAAAGLGGGSADAAAVLLALNDLYEAGLATEKLQELALKLGADVPFFIKGGTWRSQGIGEILTALKPFGKGCFLLCKADEKPSTAEMYKKLDSLNYIKPDIDGFISACEKGDEKLIAEGMKNSFTAVWENSATEKRLLKTDALAVSLSGSGPTWFGYYNDKNDAKKAKKALKTAEIDCYLVKPVKYGIEIA